jgi:hypothetical protein
MATLLLALLGSWLLLGVFAICACVVGGSRPTPVAMEDAPPRIDTRSDSSSDRISRRAA